MTHPPVSRFAVASWLRRVVTRRGQWACARTPTTRGHSPCAVYRLVSCRWLNSSHELVDHLWVRGNGERRSGTTVLAPGRYRAVWGGQTKEFEVGGADLEIAFD